MFPKIWQKSTNHGICFGSCTALGLHKIVCISFIILCDEPAIVTKLLDVGLKNNEKHSNATSKINSNNFTFSEFMRPLKLCKEAIWTISMLFYVVY